MYKNSNKKDIYSIDYLKLKSYGIKCLLLDLDNTLVTNYVKKPTRKLKDFIEKLKDKFPNLTYEGNKSQIMQLFRYIFREVNKEHPELQNSDDNFDEDNF